MQINLEHGVIAAVVGVIGAILTKILWIITKIISLYRKKMELEFAESVRLRTDLGKRCEALEEEMKLVRKQVEYWSDKYHTETLALKAQVEHLKIEASAFNIQLRDIKSRKWIPEKEKDRYE